MNFVVTLVPCHRGRGISWLRLAACLALLVGLCLGFWPAESDIVTAPGLLTVTVYAADEDRSFNSIVLEEGIDFPYSQKWHPGINAVPGLPITLDYPSTKETVHFDITVHGGQLHRSEFSQRQGFLDRSDDPRVDLPSQFIIGNSVTMYWKAYAVLDNGGYLPAENISYLDIVIYDGDSIIGYAVIRIQRNYDDLSNLPNGYYASLLVSRYFPHVDGHHQDVTEEYVRSLIEAVKEN